MAKIVRTERTGEPEALQTQEIELSGPGSEEVILGSDRC